MNKKILKLRIKKLLYESLRKRSRDEYRDLLYKEKGNNNDVPWLYLRFFAIGFIVFSFGIFFNKIFDLVNYSFYVSIGSLLFGITYLILVYEMIKAREISLLKLLLITLITGVISLSGQLLLTLVIKVKGNLFEAIRAGTLEEVVKGISSICTILIIQKIKRNKLNLVTTLLIGCSVGLGFGVIENFDYLFKSFNNEVVVLELSFIRGLQLIVTHMFWTGIITYMLFRINKTKDVLLFLSTVLACMAVHVFWDIDVISFINDKMYFIIKDIIIVLISIFEIYILIKIINKNNKKQEYEDSNIFGLFINKLDLKRTGFVKIMVSLILISFLFMQSVYLDSNNKFFRFETSLEYYKTYDDFYNSMSGEYKLEIDRSRAYNTGVVNYDEYYVLGKMKYATQIEEKNDILYLYRYINNDNDEMVLDEVRVSIDGTIYNEEYLYDINDEANSIVYYHITDDSEVDNESDVSIIRNANFIYDNGKVYIEHVNKRIEVLGCIMLGSIICVMMIGFGLGLIDYKRYENLNGEK